MFNGKFIEGETQSATLPDESSAAFDLFVGWLYRGVIEVDALDIADVTICFVDLFVFAEKYDVCELRDNVMDTFLNIFATKSWL